jgi:hypothetical protein
MHEGTPLTDIALKLADINENSTDLLVHEPALSMEDNFGVPQLRFPASNWNNDLGIPPIALPSKLTHSQIATHLDIPQRYYDLMLNTNPDLLYNNVNSWFHENQETTRLIRIHRGHCRAFLSDRYRPLDNWDLAQAVLPQLAEGFEIRSCELTERNFYIKAISHEVPAKEVEVGDLVKIGICIRNSDVGCAALSVSPIIERLICKNGMTIKDMTARRRHVGKRNNGFEENSSIVEMVTDETQQAQDKAFWLTVRDTVANCAKESTLDYVITEMQKAKGIPVFGSPIEVIQKVCRKVNVTDSEQTGVLDHLIRGGDLTAYGVANAITRQAEDITDYDRASELEQTGWQVLRLPPVDFSVN